MKALSREEVRAVDCCAMETIGVAGVVLMENAGRQVADAVERFLEDLAGRSVAIVCGAGNNGGDGYVIARHLAMRGAKVVTFLVASEGKITGDARINLDIIRKLRHDVRSNANLDELGQFDLIVDAVGGTGIRGPLRDDLVAVVEQINSAAKPVIAVDIPTGLDCDEGPTTAPAVKAALTVTFVAPKKGFNTPGAATYTGIVQVADIGIPAEIVAEILSSR